MAVTSCLIDNSLPEQKHIFRRHPAKRPIKGDQREAAHPGESREIRVRKLSMSGARRGCQSTKFFLDSGRVRFRIKNHTRVGQKKIVIFPDLNLCPDFIAHHHRVRDQAEKAHLCDTAESRCLILQAVKP